MENLADGISVIICCYNSGWIISRCLSALKGQRVRDGLSWEIVLVDNNCTDDTVLRAKEAMNSSSIEFRIVQETVPGLLNARKKGIAEVKYTYTVYCDDDNLLSPDYLDTMYGILSSDSKIGAAGGKGIAEFETEPDSRILDKIAGYAVGSQLTNKHYLFGAGLSIKTTLVREIYQKQRMYLTGRMGDKLLAGDDSELTSSIELRGLKLYPTDDVTFIHVLKSDRLSLEYLEEMFEGFDRSKPVLHVIFGVIEDKNFYHIMSEYRVLLMVFIKYALLFWKKDSSKTCRCYRKLLSNYNNWGLLKLARIYKDCLKIKEQAETSI